jgi:hypothetical protein
MMPSPATAIDVLSCGERRRISSLTPCSARGGALGAQSLLHIAVLPALPAVFALELSAMRRAAASERPGCEAILLPVD